MLTCTTFPDIFSTYIVWCLLEKKNEKKTSAFRATLGINIDHSFAHHCDCIPAVCKLLKHQVFPKSHHRQYPTDYCYTIQLCPVLMKYQYQQASHHQLYNLKTKFRLLQEPYGDGATPCLENLYSTAVLITHQLLTGCSEHQHLLSVHSCD